MLDLDKINAEELSDEDFIRLTYYKSLNEWPDEKNPKTFCEKIHYIKLSNWLEDKYIYVDKYEVRKYVEKSIGKKYLTQLYRTYNDSMDIDLNELPESFALKLNNGSGYNMIVKNKYKSNDSKIKEEINKWLASDYYKRGREKQYKNIKNIVLCEEYLEDENGELKDYKFFCFNGKFKFVQVDSNRFNSHYQNFYDIKWNKLKFTYITEKNDFIDNKPEKFEEMVKISELLSSKFPFVRVDLYYVNNNIYFGELTFTPNNGRVAIKPYSKDIEIANFIDLNKYK